jgi:hypothetical protein
MLVHDRYGETYGMLAVASVTATIRASANVSMDFGLSRSLKEDYDGNLVPLAAGVAFEENPTISYVPLGGEQFVQRLLSPLSMEEVLSMEHYLAGREDVYTAVAISRINGISNPFATGAGPESETFCRVMDLFEHLRRLSVLRIARGANGRFEAVIQVATAEHEEAVTELLELTGIAQRPSDGRLVVPIRVAAEGWSHDAFNFETRSVLEILRTAAACIEVPEPHLEAGVVEASAHDLADRFMRIAASRAHPGGEGAIAVQYRGWWYYVDDADPVSKQAFLFLRTLVGLRLHERGKDQAMPVITVPVG